MKFLRGKLRAQAAVELALLATVLCLLLIVASDLARVFYMGLEVNGAARAGVEYGVQNSSTAADIAGMQNAAKNDASDLSGLTATASKYCACPNGSIVTCPAGAPPCSDMRVYVKVITSATFAPLVTYPGIPSSVTVNGSAIMRQQ